MLGLNGDFVAGSQRVKKIRRICDLHHGLGLPWRQAGGAVVGQDPCCAPSSACLRSFGVIGVVAGLATGRTHQRTGILCAAHFESSTLVAPGAERLVRSGCQSRETRACFVRRCICVACGLGPDSENKVRALCSRIANRSFSERWTGM
jgi:hypothetical protein